jgi:hypothetical protein
VLPGGTVLVSGRVSVECARALQRLGDGSISEGLRRLWVAYTRMPPALRDQLRHVDEAQGEASGDDDW